MAVKLKALYGDDDAIQLLAAAKRMGFTGSTRTGSSVRVGGFSNGNGPDELKAWQELKKVFGPLHIEVSQIGRDVKAADLEPIPVKDVDPRRVKLHRALDKVLARDAHMSNTCLRCNGTGEKP